MTIPASSATTMNEYMMERNRIVHTQKTAVDKDSGHGQRVVEMTCLVVWVLLCFLYLLF